MPIVKKDKDIDALLQLPQSLITKVIEIFMKTDNKIHVLRAIEPNLRLGGAFASSLIKNNKLDMCYDETEEDTMKQCLRFGSKKQISESVALFEDKQQQIHSN